ncbi:MAG: HNH endonuclease [Bacteroidia bacterium]|nr:HNH endonuclease [Bacteroidia bacterium]
MPTRRHNTNKEGNPWSLDVLKAVWAKAKVREGFSEEEWREDLCGKHIQFNEHGNRSSNYGWEIDHINPVSNGGTDDLENLQALFWKHNMSKADRLDWKCSVLAPLSDPKKQ